MYNGPLRHHKGTLGSDHNQLPSPPKPVFSGVILSFSRALRSDFAEIPASAASAFTRLAGMGPGARMPFRKSIASSLAVMPSVPAASAARAWFAVIVTGSDSHATLDATI